MYKLKWSRLGQLYGSTTGFRGPLLFNDALSVAGTAFVTFNWQQTHSSANYDELRRSVIRPMCSLVLLCTEPAGHSLYTQLLWWMSLNNLWFT